jgi:phosphatidylserine synthase
MMLIGILTLSSLSLFSILSFSSSFLLVIAFTLLLSLDSPIFFIYDELLEHVSENDSTGAIRSLYLTFQNSIWVIAPLLGMLFLDNSSISGFRLVYSFAFCILVSGLVFQFLLNKRTKKEEKTPEKISNPINTSGMPAIVSHTFLHLFYLLVLTVGPVYMHKTLLWSWSTIGIVTALALLMFPVVQFPLGKILDKTHKEPDCILWGLLFIACMLVLFITTAKLSLLLGALFFILTRVGAATVELANETYLFKHISDNDRSTIALFRSQSPLMYLATPLLFWFIEKYGSENLYLAISIALLLGVCILSSWFFFIKRAKHLHPAQI